ncbi:MAG: GTPase HflX [Actinobacteria bacterium]|nr:MAG: GTPase HflX [Actinomycetota bacterium]
MTPQDHRRPESRRRITELPPELQALRLERAVLVGLSRGRDGVTAEDSLDELRRLAETAGSEVVESVLHRRDKPDPATFIGKGKAQEVRDIVRVTGADTVILDEELSHAQLRNLEELFGCKVIDRTALIIDIFAQHAHSAEGKAQVELAQLNYFLPRLRGWGESMSRLGGGIGTRGPGETKLEVDRRRIKRRIAKLRDEIEGLAKTRTTKRADRARSRVSSVALVGYTNAGKSTLLNRLTEAGVLVEDRLFSTLDPTTRRLQLPDGRPCVMTDTVGFVRKLPHTLVEAFASTLEEAVRADLILHVVDGAEHDPEGQYAAVREVLGEIGAAHVPELVAINKADLLSEVELARVRRRFSEAALLSARTGDGIDGVLDGIAGALPHPEIDVDLLVPYDRGDVVAALHAAGAVVEESYAEDGTRLRARLREDQLGRLEGYVVPRAERRAHRS